MFVETNPALRVSVVVPTRHRNELLAETLGRLAPGAQTGVPGDWYEVIVTDNGQTSTAEQMLAERFPWAQWVKGPGGGPGDNRNSGARAARAAWIAFTDDDCLPDADWLGAYLRAMETAASATSLPVALEGAIHAIGDFPADLTECPVNLTGGNFWTANVMIRRDIFEQLEGFDTTFPNNTGGEDHELYQRLKKFGSVPFVPDAFVSHPIRRFSVQEVARNAPNRAVAWSHFLLKHKTEMLGSQAASVTGHMIRAQFAGVKSSLKKGYWGDALAQAIALPRVAVAVARHVRTTERAEVEASVPSSVAS